MNEHVHPIFKRMLDAFAHSVTDAQPAGKKGALASSTEPRQGTQAGEHGGRRPPDAIKHVITQRDGGGIYIVACSCGASRQFPRQNALARAAKVRAWIAQHDRDIAAESSADQGALK